ncbi:cytochrome b/b6 domain-containing protein [Amorphus orientalis]|uniref:Cytochrome b n=1 Tax=Amorphus orientalis TaxID=649198 RepID=A0AAE3VQX5_9HYPH|nr:cytochrome b/b6 domain-containing protein [Amorphus orientalis]MDQ0316531.1 cytochrome b [Amorphus orientalis]
MADPSPTATAQEQRIWDPIVRITHWLIALAILINGLITEGGSLVHIWVGYVALAMLVLRLLWGFVGTEEARFRAFPPSVSGARRHVGDLLAGQHRPHRSHNPLGTWMVYALWATLSVIVVTGLLQEGTLFPPTSVEVSVAQEPTATRSAYEDDDGEEREDYDGEEHDDEEGVVAEIHEIAANLILILAALHVGGVIMESRLSGTNLAAQMVTGRRRTGERA